MGDTTPVRTLGDRTADGYVLLRDAGMTYLDGAEARVFDIVHDAHDISSSSDELIGQARGWPQRYHLDPARANVLRPLGLSSHMRVLEVGAGCGAITRYLGESGATVDALEPVAARARVARERTRDLPDVEVFVGELDDVPNVATYDLIVVVGVLEYVGGGSQSDDPYLDFLRAITSRLTDTGSLALAIENRLGVKYLCGAPEDHTNRSFDSLEGYPYGSQARTFSRRELSALFATAELDPMFLIAFPDYKVTRAVLSPWLPKAARPLLYRIPQFPSPDWGNQRPHITDEHSLWRTLVEADLAADFGNSFLVIATKVEAATASRLWPANQLGEFYSTNRAARYTTHTTIEQAGDVVLLRRRVPNGEGSDLATAQDSTSELIAGRDVIEVMAVSDDAAIASLLKEWLQQLDADLAGPLPAPLDLVPHNLIIDEAGRIRVIDEEWRSADATRERIVQRGILWLAHRLAALTPPQRWPNLRTVRDLALHLGAIVGLDPESGWFEVALDDELELGNHILAGHPAAGASDTEWTETIRGALEFGLTRPLSDQPLGERMPERYVKVQTLAHERGMRLQTLDGENARLLATASELQQQLGSLQAAHSELERAYAALLHQPVVRVLRAVRHGIKRALPPDSRRRALYYRLTRTGR